MLKHYFYRIVFIVTFFNELCPLQLDRVILSTNENPNYIQFWPTAAKAWQEIVGVRPTLALIASEDVQVDRRYGDVIRFEPIKKVFLRPFMLNVFDCCYRVYSLMKGVCLQISI
jgi:hypothetical protein